MQNNVNNNINELKIILPEIIDKPISQSIEIIGKCLLKSFVNEDTNINVLINSIELNCPTLLSSLSQININTLENLNNPDNLMAFINLIIGCILSLSNIASNLQQFKLKLDKSSFTDFSFLVLITLIIEILLKNDKSFGGFLKDKANMAMFINVIVILQNSYIAFMNSDIFAEILQFLDSAGFYLFNDFDKCCKCSCNPFKKPNKKQKVSQKNISLRTGVLKYVINKPN